jgi:cytoskeletal protein RodZ
MRALKALVTIMAVIIVVGVGAVIWGIVRQANKLTEPPETSPPLQGASIVGEERNAPWQNLVLNQPAGTRIATVTSAGDLVVLHLYTETPGRDERVVIVDPGTGTLLGTITLGAKP